jgi:hypothetical protein
MALIFHPGTAVIADFIPTFATNRPLSCASGTQTHSKAYHMTDIAQLLEAYDTYGDFQPERYFVTAYGCAPSAMEFEVPAEQRKETLATVLELLNLSSQDLVLRFKKWKTTKHKGEPHKDYPNYYFFASTSRKLCIEIHLGYGELSVEFLYHHGEEGLEEWIKGQLEQLREQLGKPSSPVFRVLSRGSGGFYTEEVNVDFFQVDIEENYNDDFTPIDQEIQASFEKERSGLILLHGKPGTGKTSYIKHLISKQAEQKFIFIPNDFVRELLQPDFVTFLITQKNATLVIEDAERVIVSRESTNQNSVVSTILQLTDGLFSDYLNIKVICTFNTDISKIDQALFRKGRLIAFYEFQALSAQKTGHLLHKLQLGETNEGLTLAEIYNYRKTGYEVPGKKTPIGFS